MKRNTEAIVRLAAEKSHKARSRVLVALQELQQGGGPITFAAVCQEAHVSKTFLYDARQADLAAEIRRLRDLPPTRGKEPPSVARPGKSDAAKDAQIARLQERVRMLEREVQRLREENAILYGRLAERSSGTGCAGKGSPCRQARTRPMRRRAMKEEMSQRPPLPPQTGEERDGHPAPVLPESPAIMPGASPPVSRAVKRGRVPRWLFVTLVGVVALAVLAGGTGLLVSLVHRQPSPSPAPSPFQTAACPFKPAAGVVEGKDVRCGYLTVPADHSRPQGPTIRLAVAIFKASSSHPAADPVIDLQGGPGTLLLAYASTWTPAAISSVWTGDRDFILLDQRGVGYSQPSLGCQANETVQACHDRLVRQGIDLDDYTTIQNAEDIHDLVRALGYHQVNLYGISYGTRLALTVMRLFPADIRSVVLDSTSPPQVDVNTGFPAATQRAFDTLFQGCAASSYCNQHYPHLQAVFAHLVSDLNQYPATVQVTNPQTGKPVSVVLTGDDVVNGLRNALYETALIPKLPKVIYQHAHHDYSAGAAVSEAANAALGSDSVGMFYSVTCSESALTPQAMPTAVQMVEPETRHYFLSSLQNIYANCQLWHVQPVPAAQWQPVTSAIPTLILAGEYDPATSPVYGMLAARTLSKSYFFLFPGMGHGVIGRISCATSLFQAFVELPTEKPDSTCMAGVGEPLFE
jgi:pimeloyl-ACP methyl ester carboxylesterase